MSFPNNNPVVSAEIDCSTGGTTLAVPLPQLGLTMIQAFGTFTGTATVQYTLSSTDDINAGTAAWGNLHSDSDPDANMTNFDLDTEPITILSEGSGMKAVRIVVNSGGTGSVQFNFMQK